MKNINISGKLIIVFAAIISVVAIMCAAIYGRLQAINAAAEANDVSRSIIIETNLALTALVEQQSVVRGYVASHDASFLSRMDEFKANFDAANEQLSRLVSDAGDKARVAQLRADAAQVKSEQDHLMALSRDPATADWARAHLGTVGRLAKARDDVKAILKPQQDLMVAHAAALAAASASASLTLLIGGLVTVLLSMGLGWLLNRSIAHPVANMTAAMGRLSSGDTSVVIPAIGRRDEVGRMADAVQIFKTNALQKAALEKTAEADRKAVEDERRKTEALKDSQAQELARVVEALGGGLSRLSSGDLTYRIDAAFTEDYAKLKGDFNLAVNTLQDAIATIQGRAHGLRASGQGDRVKKCVTRV